MQYLSTLALTIALLSSAANAAVFDAKPYTLTDAGAASTGITVVPTQPPIAKQDNPGFAFGLDPALRSSSAQPAFHPEPAPADGAASAQAASAEVPLPPAVWLFGTAILGFAGFVTRPGG